MTISAEKFVIRDIGSVVVLPQWHNQVKATAYTEKDGKVQVMSELGENEFVSVGKVVFKNCAMIGRAMKVINKQCRRT